MLLRHIPREHLDSVEQYCVKTLADFSPVNEQAIEDLIRITFNATRHCNFEASSKSELLSVSLESIKHRLQSQDERRELVEILVLAEAAYRGNNVNQLANKIEHIASYLSLHIDCLSLVRNIASHAKEKAYEDWIRHNWSTHNKFEDSNQKQICAKFNDALSKAIIIHKEDQELIKKIQELSTAPSNSIGKKLWTFINDHHFTLPGRYGGASSALQRHDWIHVLGDYETDFIGELECAAFGATTSTEPGANMWLIGMIAMLAGHFHIGTDTSESTKAVDVDFMNPEFQRRLLAAITRGRDCKVDLLSIDFFEISHESISTIRNRFGV